MQRHRLEASAIRPVLVWCDRGSVCIQPLVQTHRTARDCSSRIYPRPWRLRWPRHHTWSRIFGYVALRICGSLPTCTRAWHVPRKSSFFIVQWMTWPWVVSPYLLSLSNSCIHRSVLIWLVTHMDEFLQWNWCPCFSNSMTSHVMAEFPCARLISNAFADEHLWSGWITNIWTDPLWLIFLDSFLSKTQLGVIFP